MHKPVMYCGIDIHSEAPKPDPKSLEVPDINSVALLVEHNSMQTMGGNLIDPVETIHEYQEAIHTLVDALRETGEPPEGFSLFVPDFWHMAFGGAKMVSKDDGDSLFNSTIFGHKLGRSFFKNNELLTADVAPHGHPGTRFF